MITLNSDANKFVKIRVRSVRILPKILQAKMNARTGLIGCAKQAKKELPAPIWEKNIEASTHTPHSCLTAYQGIGFTHSLKH